MKKESIFTTPLNVLIRIEEFTKGNMKYILKVTRISFVNAQNPELFAVVRGFLVNWL